MKELKLHEVVVSAHMRGHFDPIDYSATPTTEQAVKALETGVPIRDDDKFKRRREYARKDLGGISPASAARLRASEARRLCVSMSAEIAHLRRQLAEHQPRVMSHAL